MKLQEVTEDTEITEAKVSLFSGNCIKLHYVAEVTWSYTESCRMLQKLQ